MSQQTWLKFHFCEKFDQQLGNMSYYILLGIRYYIFSYVLGKDFRLYLHSSISQFSPFSFHWSEVPMRDSG